MNDFDNGPSAAVVVIDVDGTDVVTTGASTLLGARWVASVAIRNDLVGILEVHDVNTARDLNFAGDTVRLLSRSGTALVERGAISVERGSHFLAFEANVAVVATNAGLSFIDTTNIDAPAVLGTTPLEEAPLSALFLDDKLLVNTESAVFLLSPPCP